MDACRDSMLLNDCVVSSDDPDIIQLASRSPYIFLIDRRPTELAQDDTSTEAVIEHVLRSNSDDIIVLLQPTSPFREGWQIDEAIRLLLDSRSDCVVGVTRSHHLLWERQDERAVAMYTPEARPRRQDLAQFTENGSIYVFTKDLWDRTQCRIGGYVELYEMSERSGMQIDTPYDLVIAEAICKLR